MDVINLFLCFCFVEPKELYSTYTNGFSDTKDLYDDLIKFLNLDESWEVISLNYDVLLEQALTRNHIKYFYEVFPFTLGVTAHSGTKVFKPHGSINFRSKYDIRMNFGDADEDRSDMQAAGLTYDDKGNPVSEPPIFFATLPDPANIHHVLHSSEHVVIANYRHGKDVNISFQRLDDIRKQAIQAWKQADEVVVIGVKPVPEDDDKFVDALLNFTKSQITYVTASKEDGGIFLKKQPNAQLCLGGLRDFLNRTSKDSK
jgi:hypothetical protein